MTLLGCYSQVNYRVGWGTILVGDYGDAYSCLKAKYEYSIGFVWETETKQTDLITIVMFPAKTFGCYHIKIHGLDSHELWGSINVINLVVFHWQSRCYIYICSWRLEESCRISKCKFVALLGRSSLQEGPTTNNNSVGTINGEARDWWTHTHTHMCVCVFGVWKPCSLLQAEQLWSCLRISFSEPTLTYVVQHFSRRLNEPESWNLSCLPISWIPTEPAHWPVQDETLKPPFLIFFDPKEFVRVLFGIKWWKWNEYFWG